MNVDVVIVGAGPVGTTAAALLHAQGLSVLLLERSARDVAASPYLSGVGQPWHPLFERLGLLDLLQTHTFNPGAKVLLSHAQGGRLLLRPEAGLRRGMVHRRPFDLAVRGRAVALGVPARFNVTKVQPILANGAVSGLRFTHKGETTDVRSGLVVAADGHRSTVATKAGISPEHTKRRLYQGRRYVNTHVPSDTFAFLPTAQPGQNLLIFGDGGRGQAYVELEADLAVAEGLKRSDRDAAIAHLLRSTPDARALLGPAATGIGEWHAVAIQLSTRPPHPERGLVLIGDAACCPDPLGSSGMLVGLLGAEALAASVASVGPAGDHAAWAAACSDRTRALRRFTRILRAVLERPNLSRAALWWLARSTARQSAALAGFNGTVDHANFLSPAWQARLWTGLG